MWKPFVKCLSPPLLPSKMPLPNFCLCKHSWKHKRMQHDFQANATFEGGLKNPKKSYVDNSRQKESILLFHSWLFITSQKQLYTLIIISENGIKCQKNINLVLVGIYIIFNNTAKTRIFFWMNIISRKTEHKTLNARKMNTNFKNQITWI